MADSGASGQMNEYRLEQLAMAGGTTVRNIRAYRDRGLLPPPRREGRIALYSDVHLGRLRLIADLLDRGYTLQSIGELLAAWERGKDIGEVLGLEAVLSSPWSDEEPVTMSRADLVVLLGTRVTDENLEAMTDIGILEPVDRDDPDPHRDPHRDLDPGPDGAMSSPAMTFLVHSVSQLQAGAKLVAEGVPLDAVLEGGRHVHRHIDEVAEAFVALTTKYVIEPLGDNPALMSSSIERLRPVAAEVVSAELSRAMALHVQNAVEAWLVPPPAEPTS